MIFILLLFIILCFVSVIFRLIVIHPYGVIYYALLDQVNYISRRIRNECCYGTIKCYIAHRGTAFGTGKTLSATREVVQAYKRYIGQGIHHPHRELQQA